RLSDKLLKSSAASLFLQRRGVCILRYPASESSVYLRFSPLTRRRVIRCSVSVEAHYRELFQADKGKFKIIFRVRIFSSKPLLTCHKISDLPFLQQQSHFLVAY
ncbi:hypothetical protein, partial [Citrobacter youngae]|uniref:hypothetical protein n=1 Tax=Citrobacter youngae TaxID=133448 RepID=UPI002380DD19